jgi:protein TonB
MSEEQASSSPAGSQQQTPTKKSGPNSLEKREQRREDRTKNTLIWRELAIIAALCLVILAFNLSWGNPESGDDMAAEARDEIRLRDVRPTPPEPEPPEPEPEPEPQPEPKVQKNQQRQEVPDEQVQEEPETSAEPVDIQDLNTDVEQTSSEPAPQPNSNPSPNPSPPKNKVFKKGTADQNAQMQGRLDPEYPKEARRANIQGQVILQFVVDESGRPQDIQVLRSPHDALAEAAVAALEEKKFTPARQNGETVKMRMSQPVTFRLN